MNEQIKTLYNSVESYFARGLIRHDFYETRKKKTSPTLIKAKLQ